jgi:cell division FtsZ-interacting protein ZapD
MVDKLNDAVGVWLSLQMRSGQFGKKATDLGVNVDQAYAALIQTVKIDGQDVDVGLPPKLTLEKVKGMGVKFDNGEFKL